MKKMKKYKIGEYIKIKSGFMPELLHFKYVKNNSICMKIIGYGKNSWGDLLYYVKFNYPFFYLKTIKDTINCSFIYQDNDCINKNKEKKIKRILK